MKRNLFFLSAESLAKVVSRAAILALAVFLILTGYFVNPNSNALFWGTFYPAVFFLLSLSLSAWKEKRSFYVEWLLWLALAAIGIYLIKTRELSLFFWAEWIVSAVLIIFSHLFFARLSQKKKHSLERWNQIQKEMKTLDDDLRFYQSSLSSLEKQIHTQERLSYFSRQMGALLEMDQIKQKFLEAVSNLFPQAQVSLRPPSLERDPIDHWVTEKKSAIAVKKMSEDKRFAESVRQHYSVQSVLAVPLNLQKQLAGLVRVDQKEGSFSDEALDELELYTHAVCLALENAQLFKRFNELASSDGLTGLATHRIFEERLEEETRRAARYHKNCVLILMDIDHFKSVNDNYGHLAGDVILKEVAAIIHSSARSVDLAARYGGEEFALIVPDMPQPQAVQIAEKIRAVVQSRSVFFGGVQLAVTLSLGVAVFPEEAASPKQLVRVADERLYRAKHGGRNRVESR